jgi:hypothetical protein
MSPLFGIGAGIVSVRPPSHAQRTPIGGLRLDAFESGSRLSELRRFDADLLDLKKVMVRLTHQAERLASAKPGVRARGAFAVSSSALDLGPAPTSTTLASAEEVNAIPTSFTPFGPSVSGNTTSLPTVGGIYDGAEGDDVLTLEFRQDRVVGANGQLRVRVYDGAGRPIESLRFDGLAPDTPVTLANGLSLSLGAGSVSRFDTFQVAVSTSVGSAVNPTRTFDGTRNDQPGFEPGLAVSAGSFRINGELISVAADDSIQTVLSRITASAAGVDASFDAATERITLTQRSLGSSGRIVLASDTSGFLAATKLASASEVLGQDGVDPLADPIASVTALAGVASGSFYVNGVAIAIDPATDSLGDLIERINASEAGVQAALDVSGGRFSIASLRPRQAVTISDGDSGFASALKIAPGRYDPRSVAARPLSEQRRQQLGDDLRDVARLLESLLQRSLSDASSRDLGALREGLRDALVDHLEKFAESPGALRRSLGIGIGIEVAGEQRGTLLLDETRLQRALRARPGEVHALLFGAAEEPGLIELVLTRVESIRGSLDGALSRSAGLGRQIDFFA